MPTLDLNHWRFSSTSVMSAMGAPQNARRELREIIEDLFRNGIEDFILPQHLEPLLFVLWTGGLHGRVGFFALPVRTALRPHESESGRMILPFPPKQLLFLRGLCIDRQSDD